MHNKALLGLYFHKHTVYKYLYRLTISQTFSRRCDKQSG